MKYAVIGAAGQLGRDICARLADDAVPLTRAQADLTQPDRLRAALSEIRADIVINCAAYNFVDKAETEPEAAFTVNAWGVRSLALICRELRCVLAHISTDYVFGLDRNRRCPYDEADAPGPVSVYGLSKLAGEYVARSICPKHFVVRTCGLYGVWGSGGKGTNFVETMLRRAAEGKPLRVVADQVCTPSSTSDVAAALAELLPTGQFGLYHITNAGSCSWYELARTIFKLAGVSADLTATTSQDFGAPAARPGYSVLNTDKFAALQLPRPRPWEEALAMYLRNRKQRPPLS
jgi:dTDP-4-dehydrorhamnose reductase